MELNIECPSCKRTGVRVNFHSHKIRYFGEVMESVLLCPACGYRHVDVLLLDKRAPMRFKIKVASAEDMLIRVVRSSTASIEIPELGVKITPGMASDGYISNIEGVLSRVEDVLLTLRMDGRKKARAEKLLKRIEAVKNGDEAVHLILEDPAGNSAIISRKAVKNEI